MKKTAVCWSSGKDSAWTLHRLRSGSEYEVVALITTISRQYDRVAMHGVRHSLLKAQAAAAGLPVWTVEIPSPCSNEEYDTAMAKTVARAVSEGITHIAFGDLFLRDIREYREQRLAGSGVTPIFPLWDCPTPDLAREMIAGRLRARVSCLDPRVMPRHFAGADFDSEFVRTLPASVDPCGERGEFHTFAYDGPMFRNPVAVALGETVERDGFVFTDLTVSY